MGHVYSPIPEEDQEKSMGHAYSPIPEEELQKELNVF
jgi:hypothetical protein